MTTLYSAGYQGVKPDQLKATAERLNAIVVDIRFSPRSRDPRWALSNISATLKPRYVHCRTLGNKNYKGGGGIEFVNLDAGTETVKGLMAGGYNVILLCACWDVHTCHRKPAAEHIAAAAGVELVHLTKADIVGQDAPPPQPAGAPADTQMPLW